MTDDFHGIYVCPVCHRRIAVTCADLFREHELVVRPMAVHTSHGWEYQPEPESCPGSGRRPEALR